MGQLVPLIAQIEKTVLTPPQRAFLKATHVFYEDIRQRLGHDIATPDFGEAGTAFRFRVQEYQKAKSQLNGNFSWLLPFEKNMMINSKPQLLQRSMDVLQQPYNQYVTIWRAARKFTVRAVLSIPLEVNVLPSPTAPGSAIQILDGFENRVRCYLQSVLPSSEEVADANDTIDELWQLIHKAVDENGGHLPALAAPHCQCTLLRYHIDRYLYDTEPVAPARTPYPYFGVSELSCFQCSLYFQAYNACHLSPPFETRGCHVQVLPFAIPACSSGRDEVDRYIDSVMGIQLKSIIGRCWQEAQACAQQHWFDQLY
ncbi:hypothetical protein DFH06DRAFT_1165466 [Mycena polygramma]|nr:hypothetical protein DFH06DRAFT_1165466 [Mycena polygramma]